MLRVAVEPLSQAAETLEAVRQRGVLLVSQPLTGRPNVMTVASVTLGLVWERPVLTTLVRPSRYTDHCLRTSHDFTIAVLPPERAGDLLFCGRHSGREQDKLGALGLTTVPARTTRAPLIDEALITYECAVIHHLQVDRDELHPLVRHAHYPDGDYHRIWFGEILSVTACPDASTILLAGPPAAARAD